MSDLITTIRRTEKAISRAKAARTSLGVCGHHPKLMADLERVVTQLEDELKALRYRLLHTSQA